MIRTLLVLRPAPADVAATIAHYRSAAILERAVEYGLVRGEVLRCRSGADVVVASLWHSTDDYTAWLDCDERRHLLDDLARSVPSALVADSAVEPYPGDTDVDTALDVSDRYGDDTPVRVHLVVS
ncbi:antibiotic biosynthesis monooxygenase family protein [Rhodococcoides kroppenstedtii]|uniref:antibiotic biosynthesis monooxygenase family protein n=1 Tax=Rhodococcoides kroppenstedtii TaxID=293050 RepID=UPI00362CA27F